jgi:hypothetical protein
MTDRQRQVLEKLLDYAAILAAMVKAGEFPDAGPPFNMLAGAAVFADMVMGGRMREQVEQTTDVCEDTLEKACHEYGWRCCKESGCEVCHPCLDEKRT